MAAGETGYWTERRLLRVCLYVMAGYSALFAAGGVLRTPWPTEGTWVAAVVLAVALAGLAASSKGNRP